MFQKKNIEINSLILWDENARFPDNYSNSKESELIEYFISQPAYAIEDFLDEIISDFDLPQLEKLVVWKDEESLVALEGNRRLTCYKLLANPEIIKSKFKKLFKKIEKLKSDISITGDFKLECVVSEDKGQCYRFLDRKHNRGNNEVNWGDLERNNYTVRRGAANHSIKLKVALSNFIKDLELPAPIKSKVLGKGFVTNFFRLTTTGPARKLFGLNLDEDGSLTYVDPNFPEKLKVIIYNVLEKEDFKGNPVDSRELNKGPQIEKYLKSVKSTDSKKVDKKIEENKKSDLFQKDSPSAPTPKPTNRVLPKSSSRRRLIPSNCRIRISPTKINNIYRELKDDLLLDESSNSVPNAVGVLFRVFLEVTLDYYAQQNMHNFSKSTTISQKIPWVVDSLKSKGYDNKTFNNINKVASAKGVHSFLSIHNFHEYVHSTVTQPSSNELKTKWDNLQSFFELVWQDLNKKN